MSSNREPIVPSTFFVLTYALSWSIWIPLALAHFRVGPFAIPEAVSQVVRLLGVLMPATAALLLTARAGGRAGVGRLLGGLALWRVNWRWWAAAGLAQPALLVLTGLAYNALGGQPPVTPLTPDSAAGFAVNAFFLLLATLGEEIGWRGVALPALQHRHSPLIASVILGLLWAAWHVPFWLLLAVVFHITLNLVNAAWLPVTANVAAFGWFIVIQCVIAALVLPRLAPRPQPAPVLKQL
jgi:membrane protease YdiL (CAAX protease family)